MAVVLTAVAEKIVLNGVAYKIKDGHAIAAAIKPKDAKLEVVQIPAMITHKGQNVIVSEIAFQGFMKCPNLRSIILPNTIQVIGMDAFRGCKKLETAILPDETQVKISPQFFGAGGNGPFKGCVNLKSIRGNNILLPDYVLSDALRECSEVPFVYENKLEQVTQSSGFSGIPGNAPLFSEFAETKVKQPMERWEKRKPYESADEYMTRVTDAKREAKLKEFLTKAREEYLKTYSPASITGTLGYYDADYNVFTVDTYSFGEIYPKVPKDEAERFKQNWSNVIMQPRFGILNDRLAVLSCEFVLGNKTYASESVYNDDSDSGYSRMLKPLSELLAENTTGNSGNEAMTQENVMQKAVDPVDLQIPSTGITDRYTFALVVGNEHYQGNIKSVPYAANDAEIFALYCTKTLGLPVGNVTLLTDATMGQLTNAIEEIKNKAKARKGESRIIFYYSGHGKPDDNDKQAYMVPVDASPYSNRTNYSLSELYSELGSSGAKLVTVFLDACFSGATRTDDMLVAARAMRQVPREDVPGSNMVVFSAASDTETAHPLEEKSHGVFTYCLLEKLRASEGKVSLGELAEDIDRNVTDFSLSKNRPQTPKVLVSPTLPDWRELPLRVDTHEAKNKKGKKR